MTASDFRARLKALCWTQRGFAAFLGVAHNTVHRWALDQAKIPEAIATWLDEVVAFHKAHPPPTHPDF